MSRPSLKYFITLFYILFTSGDKNVPGHQGFRGLNPLGPTLKEIILGVMLLTWFLDPSSHWLLCYVLAFHIHVLSL